MNGTADCGAFLERFQREHHELNCAVIEIRKELGRLDAGEVPHEALRNVSQRLNRLAGDLRLHFQQEEEFGTMGEALARCPSLTPRVQAMLQDHRLLLQSIAALAATAGRPIADSRKLAAEFEDFAAQLKSHEELQNRLLLTALGGEAAEYDVEGNE